MYGADESTYSAAGALPLLNSWPRMLVGQCPLNIEALFERIRTSRVFAGAQSGIYITAVSGLEIARWDVAGKAIGIPTSRREGG